ncbi:MAG TPA: O-antigen ligase family protein [Tenuifilaceae bacterium]|nr:O-antigen ligase family protein [Tenuifilaceae bacterium]
MTPIFSPANHRKIFLVFLGMAFCSLPYSRFSLSVSLIALGINWILEGDWRSKLNRIKGKVSLYVVASFYLMYLVGLLYTSDLHSGVSELQQKLPLLLLPLILSSSEPLRVKEFFGIMIFFLIALVLSTFYSTYLFVGNFIDGSSNVREISPFISHIRLGLMVNLALFLSFFFTLNPPVTVKPYIRIIFLCVSLWLTFYLFLLQSLTGIVVFFATILILLVVLMVKIKKPLFRYISLAVFLIAAISITGYLFIKIDKFFVRKEISPEELPVRTQNGNLYTHAPDNLQYENGYPVWVNICEVELEKQWNIRSNLSYSGEDKMGQPLKLTLIRYLTSKGLSKDSVGMDNLDPIDVHLIESGATSVIFREHKFGLYPRLYQLLWEIDQYKLFRKVGGSPFIQRLIYQKAAIQLIKQNFWFGVGTGDFSKSFNEYYAVNEPNLNPRYWFLSHNQFLTQWVALGFIGLLLFLAGWFAPFIIERSYKDLLALSFMIILTLSMLNEDTLETHIGVSMVSLFYGLIVFGQSHKRIAQNGRVE